MTTQTLNSILTGLALGLQFSAFIFVVLLMRKKFLTTSTYFYIALSLFVTTLIRIDNLTGIIPDIIRAVMYLTASLGMSIGFGKMWASLRPIKK